jgi:predicted phage terminase large subunit-like protein
MKINQHDYNAIVRDLCQRDFHEYRKEINGKKFKDGWWQREIDYKLQRFYERLIAGERPKLVVQAPPQHGKSAITNDFISWVAGKNPDFRTIYTSFSERLGIRANLHLQRVYDGQVYKNIFPDTRLNERNSVTISGATLRNREVLEYEGHDGYFRNTTVRGSITGEGLDLGIIDDPLKGRESANSQTIRDKTWDWFTDDFFTRFSDEAGFLIILTRWHVDDPVGRMADLFDDLEIVTYPAIAEKDEAHRKVGEALFPEHKSLQFLLDRKKVMADTSWQSLYQQNPFIKGGELFLMMWWKYYRALPVMQWRGIYGDTAQKTKQQNDYTVLQCWGKSLMGQAYLIDQWRGKVESPELLIEARAFWNKHNADKSSPLRHMKIEDKVSGTGLIQTLSREGIPIIGIPRNTDKLMRANDVSPLVESGNVFLNENASYLSSLLAEASQFPNATHDDQIDPLMDALTDILQGDTINYEDIV